MPSLALLVFVALSGCRETTTTDLAEWSPADHQQESVADEARGEAPEGGDADPEATEIQAATSLFRALCAGCHGESGRGDGPQRPPVAPPVDFSGAAFQTGHTDEQLEASIRDGLGGFMPAFGDRLSPEGIAALVRHVRRLSAH